MKPLPIQDFPLDPARTDEILEALVRAFEGHEEVEVVREVVVHDTFDWRLHDENGTLTLTTEKLRSGAVARRSGPAELVWCDLDGGEHVSRLLSEDQSVPAFEWQLGDDALARGLRPLLEMRRLLEVVRIELRGTLLRLLDGEGKTVAKARFEMPVVQPTEGYRATLRQAETPPAAVELPARLRLEPVRGYAAAAKKVRRVLADEFGLAPVERSLFDEAIAAVGLEPGSYSSKIRVPLDPSWTAEHALRKILRRILEVLLANEAGTRADLDSEFLHDFRVAIRRTRSALGQIKGVFPPDRLAHFRRELAWVGRASGATRDLDVYLLKMPAYQQSLPADVRQDLDPLRTFLEEHQRQEQKKLARLLRSERYRTLIEEWSQFLEEGNGAADGHDEAEAPPNAGRPVGEVASRRIWKAYRRVVRKGSKIDESSPDQALHDLRIDCKKLRYSMELFAGLFDQSEITAAIKDLKRLQENLGDFNDYSVQREKLADFAEQMRVEGSAETSTFLAMGQLMHRLREGQLAERERFASRFRGFVDDDSRARFERLFRSRAR